MTEGVVKNALFIFTWILGPRRSMTEHNSNYENSMTIESALYIIATPIGNMEDITLRAARILGEVDVIAAEDTRVTGLLLAKHEIKHKKMMCYNDYSTEKEREQIIAFLSEGKAVALVSDAGTPLISDPGYKLVREVSDRGFKVVAVAGPSSVTTALSICGLPTDRFLFDGFLPPKKESRTNALTALKDIKSTLVFFESAKRLVAALKDIDKVMGDRETAVLREITKKFEEVKRGLPSSLIEYYTENPPKGEIVLVIAPPTGKITTEDVATQLAQALLHMSLKDAVAFVTENTGANKKDVYKMALGMVE
jgi:16S rRNA (cytidine1402-2'-O)-methyltransferase